MSNPLLSGQPGEKLLLLGNEAIVRGALEAGVGFVSCYPGTPSSEIPDTFFRLSSDPEAQYIFEYSPNEKVAMETAGGAALAGVPALVTMKHVGLNVAADPFMTLAYIGTPGGMVIVSADDPGCHSSQNEQDNRYFARLAGMPSFEPVTAQEARDMAKEAFSMSASWQQPIMLRTTTRVNHLRGSVSLEGKKAAQTKGSFVKNPRRFVPIPAVARIRHGELLKNLQTIAEYSDNCPWNKIYGQGDVGFIASGISRAYLKDVLEQTKCQAQVLELGFSWPLPQKKILQLMQSVSRLVILEELEPIVEQEVRALAQKHGISIEIIGKGDLLPLEGEYSTSLIQNLVNNIFKLPAPAAGPCPQLQKLPMRPPNLCTGCPHRATYFAVRKIFGDEAVYSSDIGCYTLGILPPLQAADFLLCMGSSISAGSGMAAVNDKPLVAFIGDSTFFHSGMTGLVNAVYNKRDLLVVILDNRTTAMTGHQPNPGVDQTVLGPNEAKIDIQAIVQACGVPQVKKVKALNHKAVLNALEEFKQQNGVRVLIAEDPCPLFARRVLAKKAPQVAFIEPGYENDTEVLQCATELGCPAFSVQEGKVSINPDLCAGCMLCVQISQHIKAGKKG